VRWIWVLLLVARTAAAHVPVTKACAACHADKHFTEFKQDCGDCHRVEAWSPSTFGIAQHAKTKYVVDGKHVATPCSGCHPSKTSFIVGGKSCLDCHQGPHGADRSSDCERCHTTGAWQTWKVDHKSWPLTGGHVRTACASCHPGLTSADPASKFRGIATTCSKCHDDVHAGQFAPRTCDRCHSTESFTEKQPHRWPIEGAHQQLACAKCHPTVALRNGDHAVRYALGFSACKDCHANPHPKVSGDCGGCHGAASWSVTANAKIDHDKTGFALRGVHATTSCGGCHAKTSRPESTCESCHRDPHGGRMDGGCAECHTAVAWSDTQTLEQHRRTRMPLTGKHALITCTACHKQQNQRSWSDTPTDCYACHEAGYHALSSHATYSRVCAGCHTTIAWLPALDNDDFESRTAHDARFPIASGAHAQIACNGCHVGATTTASTARAPVRCDGCHATHSTPVPKITSACLRCHPRGARR
jgi:hypothetical protein